jgi:hypothetical protein
MSTIQGEQVGGAHRNQGMYEATRLGHRATVTVDRSNG